MRRNSMYELNKYVDKVKKWKGIIKKDRYTREQNTIIKFIIPLFGLLGWGALYKDMEFEYPIISKKGKRLGRVDIALYTEDSTGKPVMLVEMKPLGMELTHGTQIFKYLKAKNINYGIYTNGKNLSLIDKRYTNPKYKPHVLFSIKLKDFIKYKAVLNVLSKSSVKNKCLDKLAHAFHSGKYAGPWNDYEGRLKFANKFLCNLK